MSAEEKAVSIVTIKAVVAANWIAPIRVPLYQPYEKQAAGDKERAEREKKIYDSGGAPATKKPASKKAAAPWVPKHSMQASRQVDHKLTEVMIRFITHSVQDDDEDDEDDE
jgi:hypothetical protein